MRRFPKILLAIFLLGLLGTACNPPISKTATSVKNARQDTATEESNAFQPEPARYSGFLPLLQSPQSSLLRPRSGAAAGTYPAPATDVAPAGAFPAPAGALPAPAGALPATATSVWSAGSVITATSVATGTLEPLDWVVQTIQYGATITDMNYSIRVRIPRIEGNGALDDPVLGFNRQVQNLVDQTLSDFANGVTTPLIDPGGFVWINFQLPSAADWKLEKEQIPRASGTPSIDLAQAATEASHSLLSARLVVDTFTGGAHPSSTYHSINYDLVAGQSLALADLFTPGADYLDRLSSYCLQNLRSAGDAALDNLESGTAPIPENFAIWNVTTGGLLITFNAGQVAAYAAGPQFVLIPYDHLADLLDPAGPLGRFAAGGK